MSRNMANLKSHTVKTTTYKLPESSGMMGTVQQAAQVANALGAVSPKFAAAQKYTHYGSFGVATGVLGYMVGATFAPKDGLMKSPFLRGSNWGIIGGLMLLSFLTRSKEAQE